MTTVTRDGVTLHGWHLPGTPSGPAFVIGHGFTNSTAKLSTRAVIDGFADFGGVIALDFRGHGRSSGFGSVGRDEIHDLDAAVGLARAAGYASVHSVGFSMGGSVALRQAVLGSEPVDTVTSVSSPSRWYIRETRPMRRVHWLLESPFGPTVGRLLGVRLGGAWPVVPRTPLEVIGQISPTPLLLIHGTDDHYFSPAHAVALRAAAGAGAQLWIEPGMAHAESAATAALIRRIAEWAGRPV
ncbi:alpha/beta hydrolase family protein [Nakamurella panacisegetis]|uniref:alpha/beta hydrolase family protein n=1 Tax=Nakamurella panacisegetis TaxID=1090615 RepID=UPI001E3EE652|nr:alpha/beta fold hydrolase [Nakamurella panacisegetis]